MADAPGWLISLELLTYGSGRNEEPHDHQLVTHAAAVMVRIDAAAFINLRSIPSLRPLIPGLETLQSGSGASAVLKRLVSEGQFDVREK